MFDTALLHLYEVHSIYYKELVRSLQDGSVGRGTCCQALGLEFSPHTPHGRRREAASPSCPLTSTE